MTSVAESLAPGRTADVDLAEKAVLASAIQSQRAAEAILCLLTADDCFADGVHQDIYAAIRDLAEDGKAVTPASVLARCVDAGTGVWHTGQAGVIMGDLLQHATPSYEDDARTVLKAAVRRRAQRALTTAAQILAEPGFEPDAGGDMIRKLIDDALEAGTSGSDLVTAGELFTSAVDRLESGRAPGVIQFPWADLRQLVPYLRPGQLVTIAARPSLGKSLLGQDLARHVAIRMGIPAILFTMEMDRDEVMDRLLSAEAGVLLSQITDGVLADDEWARIAAVQGRFAESKLVIDDTPRITPAHIRARLRGMARREAAQVVIVDYLQLMEAAGGENRQREVSALVSGLKAVAREFRIPVVMLCQLNRGPEGRHDKRPFLSDARESGAVENDSDVAILIHRPDHYEPVSARAGEADLIVDKNRNGARGTVTVGFQGHYARFVDLSKLDPATAGWTPASVLGER